MQLPHNLRALTYKNFRLYFSGQAISLIGTWMQRMAVSWLVYDTTHSAFLLGIVVFAGQAPVIFLSPYGGAFCDRHSRYKVLMATQVASMIQAGLLAALVLSGNTHIIPIIVLSVVLGIINAFDTPARQSLMIRMIDDQQDLPNAIALNSSMVTLARLLGPAAAGILLSAYGEGVCFFINFISFVAVIASLLFMKVKEPEPVKNGENIWTGLKNGYQYINQNPDIRTVILLMAFTSFFAMPYTTLLPVYAKDIFRGGETAFSLLNSISGLGALGGAIFMTSLKPGRNLPKIIIYTCTIFVVSLSLFAYTTTLWLGLIAIMFTEFGMLAQISSSNTYIQMSVDENMRARVISYYVIAFQGMQPLGSFLVGMAAHRIGTPATVFTEGAIGILVVVLFIPIFKKYFSNKSHNITTKNT